MPGYALHLSAEEIARYRLMAAMAEASERDAWVAAGIVAGARVADVGCGPGAVLSAIAGIVGPTGQAIGVDAVASTLAAAASVTAGQPWVRLVEADAAATGLAPGSLDVAVMRHVLAHVQDHEQEIVAHLAGLVRPGGAVYLVDVDFPNAGVRPDDDPDLAEGLAAYVEFHRRRGNNLQTGRRLDLLLRAAGLEVEEFVGQVMIVPVLPGVGNPVLAASAAMVADGVVSPADVDRFAAASVRLSRDPDARLFVPEYRAVGRRTG